MITLAASEPVTSGPGGSIAVRVEYYTPDAAMDADGDGVPDECSAIGDVDGDGDVDGTGPVPASARRRGGQIWAPPAPRPAPASLTREPPSLEVVPAGDP